MKTYLKDLAPEEVIRRLKAGEVVKHEKGNYEKKWIDGIICTIFNSGGFIVNDFLREDESAYFETPDELKLEVGKCYKTRDGRKAFVFFYDEDENEYYVCVQGINDVMYFNGDGSMDVDQEHDLDLISEWSDDDVAED